MEGQTRFKKTKIISFTIYQVMKIVEIFLHFPWTWPVGLIFFSLPLRNKLIDRSIEIVSIVYFVLWFSIRSSKSVDSHPISLFSLRILLTFGLFFLYIFLLFRCCRWLYFSPLLLWFVFNQKVRCFVFCVSCNCLWRNEMTRFRTPIDWNRSTSEQKHLHYVHRHTVKEKIISNLNNEGSNKQKRQRMFFFKHRNRADLDFFFFFPVS